MCTMIVPYVLSHIFTFTQKISTETTHVNGLHNINFTVTKYLFYFLKFSTHKVFFVFSHFFHLLIMDNDLTTIISMYSRY